MCDERVGPWCLCLLCGFCRLVYPSGCHALRRLIDALTFLLSTTIIMNANATIGPNNTNTNNMNTTELSAAGNDLLQVIGGGGLPALEVVAASSDTFPPLKAAVVEALAIIGIIKVCILTSIIPSCLSMRQH